MARRGQKKGQWLAVDDTTGFTRYASELQLDYWGNRTALPLKRNLQEIATPLNDPQPVPFYRGPQYESVSCAGEGVPTYVGSTNVRTNTNNAAAQAMGWTGGIGSMSIGCTFIVG